MQMLVLFWLVWNLFVAESENVRECRDNCSLVLSLSLSRGWAVKISTKLFHSISFHFIYKFRNPKCHAKNRVYPSHPIPS